MIGLKLGWVNLNKIVTRRSRVRLDTADHSRGNNLVALWVLVKLQQSETGNT